MGPASANLHRTGPTVSAMTVQGVSPGHDVGQAARSGRQPGELSTAAAFQSNTRREGSALATAGEGRIFFAAKPAARLIRVVLLTLVVMTTVGGGSGSTQGAPPKR